MEKAEEVETRLRKRLKAIDKMDKKRVKGHLKELGLSTKGTHDYLVARYKKAVESESADEMESHQAEWEEEERRIEEENEDKMAALKHLKRLNAKYATMKAPKLRAELQRRGLATDGKKAVLVGRMEKQPLGASRKGNKA